LLIVPAVVLGGSLAATACTSSGSTQPPTQTPTPSPSIDAADQLQALALTGTERAYTAVYLLRSTRQGTASVSIRRRPYAYRLDVRRGSNVSILIQNVHGTYSCHQNVGHRPTCLTVAKAGRPVPPLFDAGQKLWSDYLTELSRNTGRYDVTPAGTTPASGSVPAGTCFAVKAVASPAPSTAVAAGTYCLSDSGIPVKATFPSGTFTMYRLIRQAPTLKYLFPVARPTPIPGLR
jgi:hypothetical protein